MVAGPGGDVYFTDPTYGRNEFFGVPRPTVLDFQGLYRVSDRGLELLSRDFVQPNGLCFSLDGTVLYVNDTERMHIRAFRLTAAGGSKAERSGPRPRETSRATWYGMKVDSAGNVWCTGPGGIHAFGPGGELLGILPVPEVVGNFAWGGDDFRTLFVCASIGLYRIRTEVPGHLPWARPAAGAS